MNQERLLNKPIENPPAFLRLPQILKLIPIGASSWWRWVAQGKAPKGIKLSEKTTCWLESDIHALIEQLRKDGAQ